jgi:hypothetical protein
MTQLYRVGIRPGTNVATFIPGHETSTYKCSHTLTAPRFSPQLRLNPCVPMTNLSTSPSVSLSHLSSLSFPSLSGLSTAGSKFPSIVRRARMVSAGQRDLYCFGPPRSNTLRLVCSCCVPEPGVLVVGVTSWSAEGVRSQVPRGGVRSYESLTLVTVALLSLL